MQFWLNFGLGSLKLILSNHLEKEEDDDEEEENISNSILMLKWRHWPNLDTNQIIS